jgi:hypothetical protein
MKRNYILILGIIIFGINLYAQDAYFKGMKIQLSNPDWNGSIFFKNTIYVYGEGGMILKSTDKGQNWSQFCINDSMNITKMVSNDNEIYGISQNQFIFKYSGVGDNWTIKDYGPSFKLNGLGVANGKIYCMNENKIYSVNSNLELLKEFEYTTDTAYYEMATMGNYIFYAAGKGKIGIINLTNNQQETIDLAQKGLCTNCRVPLFFITGTNKFYFFVRTDFFEFDANSKNITKIKNPIKISDAAFGIYNDKLYNIYTFEDNFINNLDSLYFYEYDRNGDVWNRIANYNNEYYIFGLKFTSMNFIDNNTIIAVGKDKLIFMSYDGGKTWSLKNSLTKYGSIKVFPSGVNIAASGFRFSVSTDRGVTWLPQKQYLRQYTSKSSSNFKYSRPYIISEDFAFTLSPSYHTTDTNITIFRNKLQNVYLQNYYTGQLKDEYLNVVNIFGNLFIFEHSNVQVSKDDSVRRNIMLAERIDIGDTLNFKPMTFLVNTSFIGGGTFENKFYAMVKDYSDSLNIKYAILSAEDSNGVIRPKYMKFESYLDIPANDVNFYMPSKPFMLNQMMIMPFKDSKNFYIYGYDVIKKTTEILYTDSATNILTAFSSFNYKNNIYINYYYVIKNKLYAGLLKNSDFANNSKEWTKDTNRFVITEILYESDSLKVVSGYDNLVNPSKLKILYLNPTINSVTEQVEAKSYMYITDPIPNPAKTQTKFLLYYPINKDLSNIEISVYNILGQIVADGSSFSIVSVNGYTAEINWSIDKLPQGVYFVNIKLGELCAAKTVVIE